MTKTYYTSRIVRLRYRLSTNGLVGGGAKLSLAKTADADILKTIIIKLQKRVQAKSGTLMLKVKAHRGCPLNEEADIRAEMGRRKPEQQRTWDEPTNRTVFQWSESSKRNYQEKHNGHKTHTD